MENNEKQVQEIREYYNEVNIDFDHTIVYYRTKRFIEIINQILESRNFNSCIDIGCASGVFTKILAKKIPNIVAFDISEEMLKVTKEKLQKKGLNNIIYVQGSAERLPFKQGVFNLVVGLRLLEYLPDYKKGINEISRVLSENSECICSVPSKYGKIVNMPLDLAYKSAAKIKNSIIKKNKEKVRADTYYRNFFTPAEISAEFENENMSTNILGIDYFIIPKMDGFFIRRALARTMEHISNVIVPLKTFAQNIIIKGELKNYSVISNSKLSNEEILACPFCKKSIKIVNDKLVSECGLKYKKENGIFYMIYPTCPLCNSVTELLEEDEKEVKFKCIKCNKIIKDKLI